MIHRISQHHRQLAHRPPTFVSLWKYLSKHGHQLGGLSAPRFLRMVGKDTFVPSYDVVAALNAQKMLASLAVFCTALLYVRWRHQLNRRLVEA